jgi:hypothetical protein
MTWDAYHRRKDTLREMLAVADRRPDVTIGELLDSIDGTRAAFATETEVLFELQMTWFRRLGGHVDRLISEGTEAPEMVAVTAWVDTAADLPGARALLDAHRDEPALRKAFAKELAYLAMSAGVPMHDQHVAVSHGRRLQDSARATVASRPPAPVETDRPGWMTRLKNVIAA